MMKVSMIALILRKLACLKMKLVRNPKKTPTKSETKPSIINSPKIVNGVTHVKVTDYNCKTVLNRMIETISLKTPSPKIQLNSLGYFV
jgi:hypothetical protein